MDQLSQFLLDAREKAKMTQAQVAKELGYKTPQFISNLERMIVPFPLDKAKKFIRITKCSSSGLEKAVMAREAARVRKYFVTKEAK